MCTKVLQPLCSTRCFPEIAFAPSPRSLRSYARPENVEVICQSLMTVVEWRSLEFTKSLYRRFLWVKMTAWFIICRRCSLNYLLHCTCVTPLSVSLFIFLSLSLPLLIFFSTLNYAFMPCHFVEHHSVVLSHWRASIFSTKSTDKSTTNAKRTEWSD